MRISTSDISKDVLSEPRFPQLLTVLTAQVTLGDLDMSSWVSARRWCSWDSVADLCAEFDLRTISEGSSAAVRYANNSNYRNDSLIRKESEQRHTYQKAKRTEANRIQVCVSDAMVEEVKRIIKESEILKYATMFQREQYTR
jgi:hypothetical protein